MVTSLKHDIIVSEELNKLKKRGFKVLDLERKSPDGIAVKDNMIFAVEVMLCNGKKKVELCKSIYDMKYKHYHMFDDVIIIPYQNKIKKHTKKNIDYEKNYLKKLKIINLNK